MGLPTTPSKNNYNISSGLHPIIRTTHSSSNSISSPSSNNKTSPQSQVRFSIPQQDGPNVQQESPPKIVFPDSPSTKLNNHGHLVDMHSRIMLDVPESIWKFHTHRKSHSRQKSLQAIIADTLASVNPEQQDVHTTPTSHRSNASLVSPLNLRPQSQLYLASESPMNSYKIPVPLEISLPPYLSPKNKQKKRSSLIFDGDGYSEFNQSSSVENLGLNKACLEGKGNDSELSLNSISSAEHDLSLNFTDGNFDEALGIDQDANVNLKLQHKNLKKNLKNNQSPQISEGSESLRILASPSKLIQIPDLSCEKSLRTSKSPLLFFDEINSPHNNAKDVILSPGRERDKLDLGFVFPKASVAEDSSDFLKMDSSPISKQFEQERKRRIQQNLSSSNYKGHGHRRSRSIHQIEDIPFTTSTPPKIPERSSRRLQISSPNSLKTSSSDSGQSTRTSSKATSPLSENFEAGNVVNKVEAKASSEGSKDTSSLYEENETMTQENETKVSDLGKAINPYIARQQIHAGASTANQDNIAEDLDESMESIEIISEHIIEPRNDQAIQEKVFNYPDIEQQHKPLSAIQSFNDTSILPKPEDVPSAGFFTKREYINLLSPRRSLSNIGSDSSRNSQFSKITEQSNATSQPQDFLAPIPSKKRVEHNNGDCKGLDGFRCVYEERDGKTIEVVLIDDETDDSLEFTEVDDQKYGRRPMKYTAASQDYYKILQMCEETATQAKNIILQLIDEDAGKIKSFQEMNQRHEAPKSHVLKQFDGRILTSMQGSLRSNERNESYISKLDRAMKVRPLYKPNLVYNID